MTTVMEFYIPEKQRKISVKILAKHFKKNDCILIEQGFYDHTEQYCKSNNDYLALAKSIYKDNINNLLFNCDQGCRTINQIKEMIVKKKYNPYNLAFLRPDELDEDNWMKIILRKNTTEKKLNNLPTITRKPCGVCKNTKFFFHQLQTRSADEPMTTFYTCKVCGKIYKINN